MPSTVNTPALQASGLHNIWLIAKREYLERIRTKAFLIATIVIPLILGSISFGGSFLASRTKANVHLAILGGEPSFAADLQHELEHTTTTKITTELEPDEPAVRNALDAQMKDSKNPLAGYIQILPAPNPGARPRFFYTPRAASDILTVNAIKAALRGTLIRQGLGGHGMKPGEVDSLMQPVVLDTSAVGDTETALNADYALFFLMYFVIMQFGMNTARSIIEEKTSRIFEVLLATIRPEEMLAGKILGVGAVGLTQVFVWMTVASAYGAYAVAVSGGHLLLSPLQIFFFVAYFVFGFLIYTSMAAALGAMTNSEQELQQLNLFLVLPLSFCLLCLVSIVRSPDSVFSRIVSLIPFCSPLLMNFRISNGHPQTWEIALSFVLMTLTVLAILWLASRIYRVGILMYGKKPNLPEIMRWLRYS